MPIDSIFGMPNNGPIDTPMEPQMITANPVADYERHYDRRERVGAARDRFVANESVWLADQLVRKPRQCKVACCWSYAPAGTQVSISDEFVAWVHETNADPLRAFGAVMFSQAGASDPLVIEFATAHAEWQARVLGAAGQFEEAA